VAAAFLLTRIGDEAVMVFFVLSGFLVGGQVIRHLREGRFDLMSYTADRATRIFVPLVPACILTAVLIRFLTSQSPGIAAVLLNMVGLNGVLVETLQFNAPLWSLAYEIWFCVIAGAVGYIFAGRRTVSGFIPLLCGAAVFTVLSPQYLLFWGIGALAVFLLDARLKGLLFIVGVILAVTGVVAY
jgi:peptidoglycan/LPS O-acetylase OafA/YrhL